MQVLAERSAAKERRARPRTGEHQAIVARTSPDVRPTLALPSGPPTRPDPVLTENYQPSVGSRRKPQTVSPAPAELSAFASWVSSEWPDVRCPWDWEPRLRTAYPGVDLLCEARRSREWEASNHTKKRHQAFFVRWLNRGNDKGTFARDNAARPPATSRPIVASPERTQAELDALARESIELAERARSQP